MLNGVESACRRPVESLECQREVDRDTANKEWLVLGLECRNLGFISGVFRKIKVGAGDEARGTIGFFEHDRSRSPNNGITE